MINERARIILSGSDRLFEREVGPDRGVEVEGRDVETWGMSPPISGLAIVNVWEIYHRMKLVLTRTEAGHYLLYRSINARDYAQVHDHATEIFNVFYIDEGVAVFSATDGWWSTTNTGKTWSKINSGPASRAAAVIWTSEENEWAIVAVGNDKKIYRMTFPGGEWAEVFDTASIWTGKRYSAIAGSPVSIIAGVGPYVIRSENLGTDWDVVQTFSESEVVKSIVAAGHSTMPIYLIETDTDGVSKLYWSHDDGDSIQLDATRYDSVTGVAAVIPTNEPHEAPLFAILGKRAPDSSQSYKLVSERVTR